MTVEGRFNPLDPLGILGAVKRDVDRMPATIGMAGGRPGLTTNPGVHRVEENLLTSTEHEVLRLAAEGLSDREIADRLGITISAVRTHFHYIGQKVGIPTRARRAREEAVAAFEEGTLLTRLTPTEREVLRLAAEGLTNREIADRRGITESWVRALFVNLRGKVGVVPPRARAREEVVAAFGKPTVRKRGEEVRVEENLLTSTEHEILRLAAEGLSNREIADRRGIDIGTVRTHFMDMRRKIGVATREEAVAALGEPTVRKRVPIRFLRGVPMPGMIPPTPAELVAPYEERVGLIIANLDELGRETVEDTEYRLLELSEDVVGAMAKARGVERTLLADINSRDRRALQEMDLLRSSVGRVLAGVDPGRAEAALRASIRVFRESLARGYKIQGHA